MADGEPRLADGGMINEEPTEKTQLIKPSDDEERDEVQLTGWGATLACDPRRGLHRYLVLILMCLLSFGSYFCYDNPAALQDYMLEDLKINEQSFMLFYAMYSYPNVILSLIGGYLLDRVFGLRLGTIIFASFCLAGQLIFALGSYINSFVLMCVGRFVFGIGGESLAVAQNTYAVSWFKGKELNMVFGFQLSVARIGSTVNMNAMKPLYDSVEKHSDFGDEKYKVLGITLFVAVFTCVFSATCAIILALFDRRAKRILGVDAATTGEVITLRDVRALMLNLRLWVICIICVAYYVTVFTFIDLGLVFFEMKYQMPHSEASIVNSLVYILSAVFSPFIGFAIDKTGKNIFWVMLGILITLGSHGLTAFTFLTPYVPVIMMGLAYSILAAALWPLLAFFIPESQLGTAYGLMQSVQNAGLAAIAQASGAIVDTRGYLVLITFYLVMLCLAMIAAVVLYLIDGTSGGQLNKSARQRRREQEIGKTN